MSVLPENRTNMQREVKNIDASKMDVAPTPSSSDPFQSHLLNITDKGINCEMAVD